MASTSKSNASLQRNSQLIDEQHLDIEPNAAEYTFQNDPIANVSKSSDFQDIVKQWRRIHANKHCDASTMQHESALTAECQVFRTCNCMKRLLFVMQHFDDWCMKNEKKRVCKGLTLNDLIHGLPHYSVVQLWNDFVHAKRCHFLRAFADINTQNNGSGSCSKQESSMLEGMKVWHYMESKLGSRDLSGCRKFARNHRARSTSGHMAVRQSLYFGLSEAEEIVVVQLCDAIWEFILHSKLLYQNEFANAILYDPQRLEPVMFDTTATSTVTVDDSATPTSTPTPQTATHKRRASHTRRRTSTLSRQMLQRLDRQKERAGADADADEKTNTNANADAKETPNEFKYSDADKQRFQSYLALKHSLLAKLHDAHTHTHARPNTLLKSKFVSNVSRDNVNNKRGVSFGVSFVYWPGYRSYSNYIKRSTHASLKLEILNNAFHALTVHQWHDTLLKALRFRHTQLGKQWRAKNAGIINKRYEVEHGTAISVAHILSILLYVNFRELQHAFKHNGCRKQSAAEPLSVVQRRNQEIGNWYKLFAECVTLFGDITNQSQIFYHAVDRRILFDAFTPNFKAMISTTSSLSVAQSVLFNDRHGIVVKLQQKRSLPYGFLAVDWMSDFQNEEEKIFSFCELDVVDIYENAPMFRSNTIYVKALILFQSIVKGHYFQHTLHPTLRYQKVIIAMIESWMKMYSNDDNLADTQIPSYMQELFNWSVSNTTSLYVIRSQYDHLDPTLKSYLMDFDDDGSYEFGAFLTALKNKNENRLQLVLMKEYKWKIADDVMVDFQALPVNATIKGKYFHAGNDVILYPRLRRSDRDFPDKSMIFCYVEDMPSEYKRVCIQWELFCKQTNYHSSQSRFLKTKEFVGYTVSKTKDLCNLQEFTFEFAVQIVKIER